MENVTMYDEYFQLVYDGDCETLLENYDYDEELEALLNRLLTKDIEKGIFVDKDSEQFYLTLSEDEDI